MQQIIKKDLLSQLEHDQMLFNVMNVKCIHLIHFTKKARLVYRVLFSKITLKHFNLFIVANIIFILSFFLPLFLYFSFLLHASIYRRKFYHIVRVVYGNDIQTLPDIWHWHLYLMRQ